MEKQQLVVVGNGMVSFKICELLSENGGTDHFNILVFGEEPRPAYDRVHLSEYFSGKTAEDLSMGSLDWYSERNISLFIGERIVRIDRIKKCITSDQDRSVAYDKLILATGSYPFVPPIPGKDKEGVFVYRTIEDLEQITAYSKKAKSAAVIGGGLLGLEAAKATHDLGLETHVVEFAPSLMPRQLDPAGGTLLKRKIEELGVKVYTNTITNEFGGDSSVTSISFKDGQEIPVEMIVISAGIRPSDELAKNCELKVGERGGIVVDNHLQTSDPNIFAIGECALHEGMIYGLIAPCYQMAGIVAKNLLGDRQEFTGADMSTQLKLMGVEVASIGDSLGTTKDSNSVTLEDFRAGIYKKLVIGKNGKHLLGAILVGDSSDYARLLSMYQAEMPVPKTPETLLVKTPAEEVGNTMSVAFLPASAIICSCNSITKGALSTAIREGSITELADLKQCTKGGTGCGGCVPLMKDILTLEMENIGIAVDRSLCEHFPYDRQELRALIMKNKLVSFEQVLEKHGKNDGCEVCRPTIASILAGCWNEHVMKHQQIQDSNDYYMANTQKNGTYSVIPRVPGGELTPEQLICIGEVARDYKLYTKITGGQRIDLFGARVEDLPPIWERLGEAGLESGHAYGKALRTVKSCVGSTWCRFGVQDSTELAIELENRYKGLRAPHKIKGGVSGCVRECAEAQGKDFGVIATEAGWNLYVGGNGGAKPQHAVLLAEDIDKKTVIQYLDRFLMYYVRTADHLTRTATWLNKMEGGIEHLKKVVIEDSLGIAEQLETEMKYLVETYECEWAATLKDPEKMKRFRPFMNTDEKDPSIRFVQERGQIKPFLPNEEEKEKELKVA